MNNDVDSSDSENENAEGNSESSDDELSFESDDEGNYQQNLQKNYTTLVGSGSGNESGDDEDDVEGNENVDGEEDEDDDDENEDGDEVSGDEVSGDENELDDKVNIYSSDDSDQLSFEEDNDLSDTEEANIQTNAKKSSAAKVAKENGTAKSFKKSNSLNSKSATNAKEPGNLVRLKKHVSNAVEAFKNELNQSAGTSAKTAQHDEYEKHDTDDEEDIRNTVGNIPIQWYDEYKHIGYDWDANKIIKPAKRDQLDDFLKRMEDPNFWRTVKDPQTGQDVILSEADIDLIKRINSRRVPDASFDDYTVCSFLKNIISLE